MPSHRGQSRNSRGGSADVLNQLARLRQQLQNEGKRIEVELNVEQKEPQVFDERLYQRPPPVGPGQENLDIIDVRRNQGEAMQDFQRLRIGV